VSEQTLIELLYGQGAHVNPLACVEDVSVELAGRCPDDFPHSIWQLLNHLNYWMGYELRRVRNENPVYPAHASESWPADAAPPNKDEWAEAVEQFRQLLSELAALAKSSSSVLDQHVGATHADDAKHSSSLRAVLWQLVVHNSYHLGQIALLRRALRAWPPKGGGDNW
jgi:uncharacterized damage-inducible protein DinB